MIRIIGIGSPFGDDAAGLEAARQLAAAPPPDTEVVAADRPGSELIELFDGAEAAILIDAVHAHTQPGTLHDIDLHALASRRIRMVSSHALGVAAAVQLAITLGRAPARGRVLGIEIAPTTCCAPGCLSPTASAAVERTVIRARQWVTTLRARAAD